VPGKKTGMIFSKVYKHQIRKAMRSLLYIIAVILIIGWGIGVFAYSATGLIHALLVIAIIALLLGIIRRSTPVV
jgi:uncharacterized membrane protein